MSFRLASDSVTLDDLEWRNSPNHCVISPNSVAFGTDYVKVVEDASTFCSGNPGNRGPQNSRREFPGISEILAGITWNFASFVFFPHFYC